MFYLSTFERGGQAQTIFDAISGWVAEWLGLVWMCARVGCSDAIIHSICRATFYSWIGIFRPKMADKDFDIIGLTTQFHKSICLVLVHLTGEVPVDCDCTSKWWLCSMINHGATHHAVLFQTSKSLRLAISNLTKVEQTIFKYAEELFEENVKRIKEE